jgi:predicted permease
LIVVLGAGLVALAMLFGFIDAARSMVAFTVRARSKTGTYSVTVRVKGSSWDRTKVGRVLNLVSIFLPPEYRAEFVEDQYANLLTVESRRERFVYLMDLILEFPRVAWEFYAERRSKSTR